MKRFTALILLATLMLSATACGSAPASTQPTTTESEPENAPPVVLTLDGSFVIVHPTSPTDSEAAAVVTLSEALKKQGITVSVITDNTAPTTNEILVGNTSRSATREAVSTLQEGEFSIAVKDNTLLLAANSPDGIELATSYFIHTYVMGKESVTLPLDLSFTHKKIAVTLAGKPLSDYTVYYADEGIGSTADIQAAKYADTVQLFTELLEKATGVRLNVAKNSAALATQNNVILFGKVSHTDVVKLYNSKLTKGGTGAYAVQLTAKENLVLAGTNPCSALAAGEAFVYSLLGEKKDVTSLDLSGKKEILRVACIGDSITYGTGSDDVTAQSYPVYLQRLLGYNYFVEKYGAPGHSLIETDTSSFLKNDLFKKSTDAKPDIVFVMLGTNDCRTQKWQDSAYKDWTDPTRKEAFLTAGQKLVDAYRAANSEVQIIFATCPTVPQDATYGTDWTLRLMRYGNPLIKEIAEKNDCPVIDIFSYSQKNTKMFDGGDGLHPKNEGYAILANGFYELSQNIIKK